MIRILSILTLLSLMFSVSACRMAYILHAAAGQFALIHHAIPVEEALKSDSLDPEKKGRLLLVAQVKDFGERVLGLKKTQNYQTVYLKSSQKPIYTVSASPKDRLTRMTWWFPVVGRMPYLGFFDLERARAEGDRLLKKDLDVSIGVADAYSTLGWFRDPVTLSLLEGSKVNLVETILHEMTHTTLYVKEAGEFNEGLAVLVGKVGTVLFMEKVYGPMDPLTIKAREILEDERIFSAFLASILEDLERLYKSPASYREKLAEREKIFSRSRQAFGRLKGQLKTNRFTHFGRANLNNAYLMSIGLYHRHFLLFEAALKKEGGSIKEMLLFLKEIARKNRDILKETRDSVGGL